MDWSQEQDENVGGWRDSRALGNIRGLDSSVARSEDHRKDELAFLEKLGGCRRGIQHVSTDGLTVSGSICMPPYIAARHPTRMSSYNNRSSVVIWCNKWDQTKSEKQNRILISCTSDGAAVCVKAVTLPNKEQGFAYVVRHRCVCHCPSVPIGEIEHYSICEANKSLVESKLLIRRTIHQHTPNTLGSILRVMEAPEQGRYIISKPVWSMIKSPCNQSHRSSSLPPWA